MVATAQSSFGARLERGLGRFNAVVDRTFEVATSLLLSAIVLMVGGEIVLRVLFNWALNWTYEINLLFGCWIYFLGIALVYYKKRDIVVEAIDRVVAPRQMWAVLVAVNVLCVMFLVALAYQGGVLMMAQLRTWTAGVGIPNYLFTAPIVIGSLAMVMILVQQSIERWRSPSVNVPKPSEEFPL